MTYEQELDRLADAECQAFYQYTKNPTPENKAAHAAAKAALEAFARARKEA